MSHSSPLGRALRAASFVVSAAASCAGVLASAVWAIVTFQPDRGMISADVPARIAAVGRAKPRQRGPERLLLVGDSVLGAGDRYPLSLAVEKALAHTRGAGSRIHVDTMWWPGWAVTSEYCLADELVELGARRVVLEVNLRSLGTQALGYAELAGYIRASHFLEALGLPLDAVGITANRMLFYRELVASGAEEAWTRSIDAQARFFNLKDKVERALEQKVHVHTLDERKSQFFVYGLTHYHEPGKLREQRAHLLGTRWGALSGFDSSYPPLRTLGALVRRFSDAKQRPLVWIAPVNVDHLLSIGIDVSGIDRSANAVRAVVEANGGDVLDLHALLRDAEFADAGDHATSGGPGQGTDALAKRLGSRRSFATSPSGVNRPDSTFVDGLRPARAPGSASRRAQDGGGPTSANRTT